MGQIALILQDVVAVQFVMINQNAPVVERMLLVMMLRHRIEEE